MGKGHPRVEVKDIGSQLKSICWTQRVVKACLHFWNAIETCSSTKVMKIQRGDQSFPPFILHT